MTEKEKMLAGLPYDCADKELISRWHKAKQLCKDYYNTNSLDRDQLNLILDQLLGSRGQNVWITAPFMVDYGENIHIGNHCEINMNCVFLDCNTITIGDNCGFGPNVQIYTVYHPVKATDRVHTSENKLFPFWTCQSAPVHIGNYVWIGGNVVILPGVKIGNRVTIGAGSVVTKDIPDDSLAVGNPCRVIRSLRD